MWVSKVIGCNDFLLVNQVSKCQHHRHLELAYQPVVMCLPGNGSHVPAGHVSICTSGPVDMIKIVQILCRGSSHR